MKQVIGLVVAIAVVCAAVPLIGAAAILGEGGGTCAAAAASGPAMLRSSGPSAVDGWSPEQVANAAIIVTVGTTKHVPQWGWVIAVATAIQESGLRNLTGGDRDSIGLFQQRPSQGWGTPQQLTDPAYQAGTFFDALLRVDGWQERPLTDAAQAVQRSAYPDAYTKHTADAIRLVNLVGFGISWAIPGNLEQCVSTGEWTQPVHAPIVSGFRTAGRPTHDGVDLGASRGTPIRAASAGTVLVVRCDISPASWGCNRDGNPSTPGCGWYVDIAHAGNAITRYCHMLTRPAVTEGQQVISGQVIGIVGSSGHSSGPHLHFEVHENGDRSSAGAVDPVNWMRDHAAPIGQP